MRTDFVRVGSRLVRADRIVAIDMRALAERGEITLHVAATAPKGEPALLCVTGHDAFEALVRLAPHALEGARLRHARHAWAVHNFFAHPFLQCCAWLGLVRLGLRVHDATIPAPTGLVSRSAALPSDRGMQNAERGA